MAISDLTSIFNVFKGSSDSAADSDALFKEVLLMTLARATSADTNIDPCEVETVRNFLKAQTGEEYSEADVRLASRPKMFAEAPFEKFLGSVKSKLDTNQRSVIIRALAKIIKSDTNVRAMEINFFNSVADALGATPAEVVGLSVND